MNATGRPAIQEQITYLMTRDLATSSHFYGEIMGLEKVHEQSSCHIFRTGAASYLACNERQLMSQEPTRLTFTLVSDDVDGWYSYLQERGVTFVKPPTYSDVNQVYSCLFHDPNGYRVEIQEFRDPNWPGPSTTG